MDTPKRRFELTASIGADSMEQLQDAIRELEGDVIADRPGGLLCSPGYSRHFVLHEDKEMTPEKYRAALKEYLNKPNAALSNGGPGQ